MTTVTPRAADLQPVRLRHPRGPVPDVRPPARRGAGLLQRGARLLRLLAARRRPGGVPRRRPLLERLRGEPRPGGLRARRASSDVVPRHGPAPAHPHALHRRQELHAAPGGRHGGRASGRWRSAHLAPVLEAGLVRLHRRLRRAAADGRDLRAGGRARRPTGPRCGGWRTSWCTARRGSTTCRPGGWRRR